MIQSSPDNNIMTARQYAQEHNFMTIPENSFKTTLSNISVKFIKDMEGYQTSANVKQKLWEEI
jgi:hypothetical protein